MEEKVKRTLTCEVPNCKNAPECRKENSWGYTCTSDEHETMAEWEFNEGHQMICEEHWNFLKYIVEFISKNASIKMK